MNQGKIWRVVNPTIGVPLFLTAVAVSSFLVHFTIYTHTTWLPAYHEGGAKAKATKAADAAPQLAPTTTAQAATPAKQ